MIDLGKERIISSAVVSTAFGHSGGGMFPYILFPSYRRLMRVAKETGTTVFTKSATIDERKGNFIPYDPRTWKYVQKIPGTSCGMINAYGLTNPGANVCARKISAAAFRGRNIVPNFYPEFAKGTKQAIEDALEAVRNYRWLIMPADFWAIELNFSCPNSEEDIKNNVEQGVQCVSAVRREFPKLMIIAKISFVHPYEFAQGLESAGANVIHAINTIHHEIVFPGQKSPLPKGGGGISGDPAAELAFEYNKGLRKRTALPLIFGCGVRCIGDAHRYFDIGADAVSMCSLAIRDPEEAEKIVREFNQ